MILLYIQKHIVKIMLQIKRREAMKTALITGFTGQVGSQMADFLLENTDYEVIGMMRWQ